MCCPTGREPRNRSLSILSVADQVRATVSQQQPAYLAKVLGLSTVNIGATAVAKIEVLTNPCILALNGSVDFQGSPSVTSPNCGVASNSTASDAFIFKGNGGISISAPMFSAGGCSQTGGNQCNDVNQHAATVPNPFSGLDAKMASLTNFQLPGGGVRGVESV